MRERERERERERPRGRNNQIVHCKPQTTKHPHLKVLCHELESQNPSSPVKKAQKQIATVAIKTQSEVRKE